MPVVLDPWATLPRQIDIQTLLEIMAGGFRYLRVEEGAAALVDHAVQKLELAAETLDENGKVTLTLPTIPAEGRIGDLLVDVANTSGEEAAIEFDGLDEDFALATEAGVELADITTFADGATARLCISQTAFTTEVESGGETVEMPVWQIARRDITF